MTARITPRRTPLARTVTGRALVLLLLAAALGNWLGPTQALASDDGSGVQPTATATPEATPPVEPTPAVAADVTPTPAPEPAATPDPLTVSPGDSAAPGEAPAPTPAPAPTTSPEPAATAMPGPSPGPAETALPSVSPAPGPSVSYIVTFRASAGSAARGTALAHAGATIDSEVPQLHIAVVLLPAAVEADRAAGLAADPAVARIERDAVRETKAAPADPRYPDQWSLPRIGWDVARDGQMPAGHAVVAVLDTGVDATHADLAGQLLPGTSLVEGLPADQDRNGHGTWMAGIVAARTGNHIGIAGVAYANVKVLPVTVLGADGTGRDSDIVSGLVYATDAGADVILMSFSAPGYSPALQAAIDYAWAHDVVVVAATGNDGSAVPTYPAGDRGVVGVASTDRADRLAPASNHGPATFLAAPGVDILTTDPDGGYVAIGGSSAAAAEVAGAAALLRAMDPDATNGMVVGRLARTAATAGTRDETGNGRLDLGRALLDHGTSDVEPSGVTGTADGGPFVGPYAAAAVRTWTGGGTDNNWTRAANWGGTAPAAGDALVFPTGAARLSNTNNFGAGTSFASITISGSGYTLAGSSITLGTGNLAETGVGATNTVNLPIALAATRTITVTVAGSSLSLGGIISGAGGLTKAGAGTLALSGGNTYTGVTSVNAGTLSIGVDSALGTAPGVATAGRLGIGAATLQTTATFTLGANRGIALAGAATVSPDTGTTLTYGGIIAGTGSLAKAGSGTLTLSGVDTYTGVTSINAGALTIAADSALGTVPGVPNAGKLAFGGGSLRTTATFTLAANRGIALGAGGATFDVGIGTTLTYGGIAAGGGAVTKAGAGTLTLSAASVAAGAVTISAGTLVAPNAGGFSVAGTWTNSASAVAFSAGTGTVTLGGLTGQTVGGTFATTFNNLAVADAAGVTLGADATVNGVLTFTSGVVTTGANTIALGAAGSVSRTSGHVAGNFRKPVATGAPTWTYEVGDAANYTPVTLTFVGVTVAGTVTVSATQGNHPQLGSSTLDTTKMAHRWWTVSGTSIVFATYGATFAFVPADVDAGASTADFVVESYAAGTWNPLVAGTRTSTSTQAAGITGFADFAAGELAGSAVDHFVVAAPATSTAGSAFNVTVTAVDAVANVVTGYRGTITFSSTDVYATFSPASYAFTAGDRGVRTFVGGATINAAGTHTVTVAGSSKSGTSGSITVGAGAFDRLLVLAPGETAAPGAPTGRTGSPSPQVANSLFTVTVRAVDAHWNPVSSTDTVAITSSDADAMLPTNATLVAGARTFAVTAQTGGPTTVTATDVTDGTKTPGISSSIAVTNAAPAVVGDSYAVVQDRTLTVAAAGVLTNDADPQGQAITVAAPRPVSGPFHGTLSLHADGSFTYTPAAGYAGVDTFTYRATDRFLTSSDATVTIEIASTAYASSSGWSTTFSASRHLRLRFPAYVPVGSDVTGATFTHTYRSETAGDTTCYYLAVYQGAALLATHGSAAAPVSCNATTSWATDVVSLPEVNSVARANNLEVVLYVRNSGGRRSLHQLATVGVDYSLR